MHPIVKKTEMYQLDIGYVDQESKIYIELNRSETLNRSDLLELSNLNIQKILPSFQRYNNQ